MSDFDALDDWLESGSGRAYRVRRRHDGGSELALFVNGNKIVKRFYSRQPGRPGKREVRQAGTEWVLAGAPDTVTEAFEAAMREELIPLCCAPLWDEERGSCGLPVGHDGPHATQPSKGA